MKKEIMEKWVKALRSGSYRQTTGKLSQRENKNGAPTKRYHYCCLGVLCQLSLKEDIVISSVDYDDTKSYNQEYYTLPPEVQQWAGMKSCNGRLSIVDKNGYNISLLDMNDDGMSFKEIASNIEKHYEEL